jgi:proline dehydrogenase
MPTRVSLRNSENFGKGGENAKAYGRHLNNRSRALISQTLDRVVDGNWKAVKGTHGRTFVDQLAWQMVEDPLATLQWINNHTPCDEGTLSSPANALITNNIGALYLTAMQRANEQQEAKIVDAAAYPALTSVKEEW